MSEQTTYNRMKESMPEMDVRKMVQQSEDYLTSCVEEYPLSTVLTALSGGIILGAVATMFLMPTQRKVRRW